MTRISTCLLERIGPDRLRLELPAPRAFNTAKREVIALVRQKQLLRAPKSSVSKDLIRCFCD